MARARRTTANPLTAARWGRACTACSLSPLFGVLGTGPGVPMWVWLLPAAGLVAVFVIVAVCGALPVWWRERPTSAAEGPTLRDA
jgi:hypothetical protein